MRDGAVFTNGLTATLAVAAAFALIACLDVARIEQLGR